MDLATGLLVVRLGLGFAMASHGAQKLLGWFGGYGLAGTAAFFERLGFRPGRLFATLAGVSELTGGGLIAVGLLGAVGPMLVVATMVVAALTVHLKHGFFAQANGYELPFIYAFAAATIAFAGPGVLSLDALLRIAVMSQPIVVWGLLALGLLGGVATAALRRSPASHASSVA